MSCQEYITDIRFMRRCIMFGSCLGEPNAAGLWPYQEITDLDRLQTRMEELLFDYNTINAKCAMGLVMFLYAMEHVLRIARVLNQPGGHILNVGVGGSGRQSLSVLASFMYGLEVWPYA